MIVITGCVIAVISSHEGVANPASVNNIADSDY